MNRLPVLAILPALLLPLAAAFCQPLIYEAKTLVYEAETLVANKEATVADKLVPEKWNIWSTDQDAAKKWSGGVVIQCAPVLADRKTPEEGCPPLHLALTGIPAGTYVIELKGSRELGYSLDGKQYKRLSEVGWRLGRFDLPQGTFDFWIDDCYAERTAPGSGYLDTVTLTPALAETMGVTNGGLEVGKDLAGSGWTWWSRDNLGSAELVAPGHDGARCLKFSYPGEKDFALTNAGRLAVKPGQTLAATAWMRCQDTEGADLTIVALGQGKLLTWRLGGDGVYGTMDWTKVEAKCRIPQGCDQIYLRVVGGNKATVWVDEVALRETNEPPPVVKPKNPVAGFAQTRVVERLDRGLLAMPVEGGKVYLGWRLLASDPATVAFNIYRGTGRLLPVKLNEQPLTKTTDFVDGKAPLDRDNHWFIKPVVGGKELAASNVASLEPNAPVTGYRSFKLQGDYQFQKVGLGDLDGDGTLDYVVKQPLDNIDPYGSYWQKSPDTYKLEAYTSAGTFLWSYDLGWGIERGIWYSPYLVYDFDGDGKAEVAAKTSEGDPRGADGRVVSGPEYVTVFDGETGKVRARADWIDRKDFGRGLNGYNLASRNQIGVAYLDGKTPCLLVARGTYSLMQVVAYQFTGGKLEELWAWDNREESDGRNWQGQGAHFMHTGDVDGDGRDEVVLGSCVIDDNGKGLWTTGLGHPDRCFLGDIDPDHPGLEVFYHLETAQKQDGVCLADARTGDLIWGLKEVTHHVGFGMAADIDPTEPGQEVWASEDPKGDPAGKGYSANPPRWLLSAQGKILARDEKVPPFCAVYWDADSQRELVSGRTITKYKGAPVAQNVEGAQSFWADVIGDWREELITSVKGELRIYSTTIPATERRVCLLQDPIYRQDVAHNAMGYSQPPMPSYFLAQQGPAMWLSSESAGLTISQPVKATVVVSAPPREGVSGTVALAGDELLSVSPATVAVKADAGQMAQASFEVTLKQAPALLYGGKAANVTATLAESGLTASAAFRVEELPLTGVPLAQAEEPVEQGGGEIHVRDDKFGAVGKAISHWDSAGHWLSYKLTLPAAGKYWVVLRYCTPNGAAREVSLDGAAAAKTSFGGTGGFGSAQQSDWAHACFRDANGQRLPVTLTAGEHVLKLTNVDGKGMNLDYVALVLAK